MKACGSEVNLNDLIGSVDFPTALWLAWFGNLPSTTQSQAIDAVLVRIASHLSQEPAYRRGIEAVAASGAGIVQAAACADGCASTRALPRPRSSC